MHVYVYSSKGCHSFTPEVMHLQSDRRPGGHLVGGDTRLVDYTLRLVLVATYVCSGGAAMHAKRRTRSSAISIFKL